jgi:hypothetical protein
VRHQVDRAAALEVPSGVPFKFPGDARLWVADAERYAHTLERDDDARSWRDLVSFEEPVELVGEVPLEADGRAAPRA